MKRGITRLYPRIHRYCLVLSADPNIADDLVQATCVRAIERAEQFRNGTKLEHWLFRISQRIWIDELRKNAVRVGGGLSTFNEVDLADFSPNPEASLLNREVLLSVLQLPEAQRVVVLLVYGEGYSYRDAAKILDIPIGTVMSRLAAARGKLKATYEDPAEVG